MKPTDILKNEHRVIEVVLRVVEAMAERAENENTINPIHVNQALDFLQHFADRLHHGKEEVHLFTWMEAHGFPRDGGPTGVMLSEHEQGRSHIRAMRDSVEGAAERHAEAIARFAHHAYAYVGLLQEHIQKEDHCLFAMADQAMSDSDRQDLLQAFERTAAEDFSEGEQESFIGLAKSLAAAYGMDQTVVDAIPVKCGCSH